MSSFWQGKKIVAYIALKHHTRFIIPIIEDLEGKGADVMYVIGQGERSQEITAIDMGLKYAHVFDYVDDSDMDDVLKNYRIQQDSIGAALKRDFVAAAAQHKKLFMLAKTMLSLETNPIPIKTAMAMKGMIAEEFRLPMCPMQPANRKTLAVILKQAKLL